MSRKSLSRQKLESQIESWQNRAAMAKKAGAKNLQEQALNYANRYQEMLNDLLVINDDDENRPYRDRTNFSGDDDDPYSSSWVPRKPKPISGAGAIALQLPEPEEEDTEN